MTFKELYSYPDADLYVLMKDGNQAALEVLFRRYYRSLCQFIRIWLREEQVCEELIADLFVKVWHNRSDADISNLKNYLFISARNLALNHRKKRSVPISYKETLTEYEDILRVEDHPQRIMGSRETCDFIISLIDLLPERQREVLLMSRIEGFDKHKIAAVLSISVRTVETTLYIAIKQLRSLMSVRS